MNLFGAFLYTDVAQHKQICMSGKIGLQDQSFHRFQSHDYCSLGKLGRKLQSDAAAPIDTSVKRPTLIF